MRLELGDPRLGAVERLVGDDRVLDQQIAGVRIGGKCLADQAVGLAVLGSAADRGQITQEVGE